MEQTLPLSKSVRVRQNIAAGLLVATNLFWLVAAPLQLVGINLMALPFTELIVGLVFAASWLLLCTVASNKAVRVASIIIIACCLIKLVMPLITNVVCASLPDLSEMDRMNIIGKINFIFYMIRSLFMVYAYSLILNSGSEIDENDRSWIVVLIVFMAQSIFLFRWLLAGAMLVWSIWNVAYYILMLIAEFRLAKCAAFTGNYDSGIVPKGAYSPLNRYFAGVLIAAVLVSALLMLIAPYREAIENIF